MNDKVMEALDDIANSLSDKQLKVGFIDGATYPDGTPVAMVAATNEYGNPANNQPPRSFFRNAISDHETEWSEDIARGIGKGLELEHVLSVVGEKIAGDIVQSISTLMDPPLSAATIASRKSKGNESTKPLVDTKVMIRDVHYEVGDIEPS